MTQQEFNQRYVYNVRTDRIGGGGFGTVYRAYDTVLDREVAIKTADVKYSGSVELSLRREYDAIKHLPEHPYIARYEGVYTFEALNGLVDCAILQYYPDGNLSQLMTSQQLSLEEREALLVKLLEGLDFLHSHRVVHRDLKPANILIHRRRIQGQEEYIPKIADFGLSKVAQPDGHSRFENSFLGGTLRYSSPEQLRSHEIRFNADLWSWAVIAYEVLMERPLFDASESSSSLREAQLTEQILKTDLAPALAQLPPKWQQALSLCLVRDPKQRVREATSLLHLLTDNPSPKVGDATKSAEGTAGTKYLEPMEEKKQSRGEDSLQQDAPHNKPTPDDKPQKPMMKWGLTAGIAVALLLSLVVWKINSSSSESSNSIVEQPIAQKDSIPVEEAKYLDVARLSVERSAKSTFGKDISFKANLLLFPNIESRKAQSYIYKDVATDISSSDKLKAAVDQLADEFIQSNLDHNDYGTSKNWDMNLRFANQHFLCVEVQTVEDTGSGTGAGVWASTYYKNLNYKTGDIVTLSDIVKPNTLTRNLLNVCFNNYARAGGDRNVTTEDLSVDLYYPEEFTFDKEGIVFYYPKYSIAAGYLGEITLRVPYWEIEAGLQPEFKRMIDASQSIELRYQ